MGRFGRDGQADRAAPDVSVFGPSPGVTMHRASRAGATTRARAITCVLCVRLPAATGATEDDDVGIWTVHPVVLP